MPLCHGHPTVLYVVGARPNYMKMAPLLAACEPGEWARHLLVHTGQHYDPSLNDAIFRDLGLRAPDDHLGVGSGGHADQTARIMVAFEKVVAAHRPALVVVAGDVNSTLACAIVAAKACVPVAHVEAGLRSFDRTMPEEINRIVTDRLTDLYLTPSPDADENLLREGCSRAAIVRVGNLMVDSLLSNLARARQAGALARHGVEERGFALVTLHRPSNVDDPGQFERIFGALVRIAARIPVVFPVHPRSRPRLDAPPIRARLAGAPGLRLVPPLGYLEFVALEASARMVLTDSGGVQEETTALGVPCLTLRENTERPITVTEGTNTLAGVDPEAIWAAALDVLEHGGKAGRIPALWDGHAGDRAAEAIRALVARVTEALPGRSAA
jgi:UDP-N-acetylglucosamine 2-epimerase (non-hydrolysing)